MIFCYLDPFFLVVEPLRSGYPPGVRQKKKCVRLPYAFTNDCVGIIRFKVFYCVYL